MGFYGLAASLLVVWSIALGVVAYGKGANSRNPEIAALSAAIETSKRLAAEAEERAAQTAAKVVTVYKDRVKVIREVKPAEIQLVERVVRESDPNCILPPAMRELWDGAAAPGGEAPKDSAGTAGAPVTVAELAAGVSEARRRFEENAARLEALQEIVKSQ